MLPVQGTQILTRHTEGITGRRLSPGEAIQQGDLRSDLSSGLWVKCEQSTWGYPWDSLWTDQVVIRPGQEDYFSGV